jgi:hypothetical protein
MSAQVKLELIKKFQRMEGCLDCYDSAYVRVCNQFECLWREECQATVQKGEEHAQNT